jgi:phenylalanyl-tRNA synthetase beta chain
MKFSETWLREWVNPPLPAKEIGERLTMAGLELASIRPAASPFSGIVVARIMEVVAHPRSEQLKVCRVDDGRAQPLQVVCGASNVVAGMLAPLARVGARMSDGVQIEATQVRGIESFGMLCSASELGLAETSTGLLPLPAEAPVGHSVREYLQLDDRVFEVDLTPNRADCLSIAGIARELATLTNTPFQTHVTDSVEPVHDERFSIALEASVDCPRYAGRVIRAIAPNARAPLWMQERLRRSGIRSLNAVVDVTNYVMLELGQPMHAFDLGRLQDGIMVRHARNNESLALLDGREVALAAGTLVIADHARVLALAGIMGGQGTGIDSTTRDVFLESAFFAPIAIAGRARAYGLATDSSHRFERGVDPELQGRALERATALLLDITGGQPGPVTDLVRAEYLPRKQSIMLRLEQVARLLGCPIAHDHIAHILCSLGCRVEPVTAGLMVVPPAFRFDLELEADLIEEVGRICGYDRIPASTRSFAPITRPRKQADAALRGLRALLVDRGYQEAITYSFVDAATSRIFNPSERLKRIANPISTELATMRASLWPGLLKTARYNLNRQQDRVRLFEVGLQFTEDERGLRQTRMLGAVAIGDVLPEQWAAPSRAVDFYDIKGDVEALLSLTGAGSEVEFEPDEHAALHPGQSARIMRAGAVIGRLGALHPAVGQMLDFKQKAFVFELSLAMLIKAHVPFVHEISRFPAIRRDIAIVVDESVTAAQVKRCVISAADARLRDVRIFDVYAGEGIAAGRKSLALGLILQDLSRTLHDEEVNAIVSCVVNALAQEVAAHIRA